ncbi:MAG: glycosyltransferase, partial [Elusimicrobiota bacterium]
MNLVILPLHDWKKCEREGFRTRDAHLMLEFEKLPEIEKILIIDRPISLPEMLLKECWWKVKNGTVIYKGINNCLSQVSEKTFVLDYFSFDILKPLILKKRWWGYIFKQSHVIKAMKYAIAYLQFHNFILFLWNPLSEGIIGKLGENLLVFDAIDNWLEHPELNYAKKEIEQGYQKIKKEADLIFTVSESLKSFFIDSKNEVYCISNGVNIDYFRTQKIENIPEDMKNITKPIVGYAGKIQDRIDVDLVEFVAENLPQINFAFIGQIINKKTIKSLLQYKNIHYLGDKHYSLLPRYLSFFDICIIPHKVSTLTVSMNPLKLYEYLAAVKPVVTTNIAGVNVFKDIIIIAKT